MNAISKLLKVSFRNWGVGSFWGLAVTARPGRIRCIALHCIARPPSFYPDRTSFFGRLLVG